MVREFGFLASIFLLAGSAMATPSTDQMRIAEQQAFQAAMDEVMAEMMAPGPKQDGWDKGGIDIYQLIEAAHGGTRNNYLLTVGKDGDRSVGIIRARDLGAIVPKEWKVVLRAGSSPTPADSDSLTISSLDGPFYYAGWENRRRVGDAFCSAGNLGGKLYESPNEAASSEIPRAMIPSLFEAIATRLEKHPMCWRYDRDGDGFKVTYFLEDGRTLPKLNEQGKRVIIIRTGPIEELIAAPPAGN